MCAKTESKRKNKLIKVSTQMNLSVRQFALNLTHIAVAVFVKTISLVLLLHTFLKGD